MGSDIDSIKPPSRQKGELELQLTSKRGKYSENEKINAIFYKTSTSGTHTTRFSRVNRIEPLQKSYIINTFGIFLIATNEILSELGQKT